jgi:hypothetical protein
VSWVSVAPIPVWAYILNELAEMGGIPRFLGILRRFAMPNDIDSHK